MSCFDSQMFYNICTERWQSYVYRVFSRLHLITWQQIPISFLPRNKKKTVYVNTSVFDWLYFLRYDAVNSMSFLLSQKSSGLFSSAKVLLTNVATNVYKRELNLINQPKTLTVTSQLTDGPTRRRQLADVRIKSSRDVGELVVNPIQLIVSRSVFINHSVAYNVVRQYRCNSISV